MPANNQLAIFDALKFYILLSMLLFISTEIEEEVQGHAILFEDVQTEKKKINKSIYLYILLPNDQLQLKFKKKKESYLRTYPEE